jgi:hypothetical protein
MNSLDGLGAAAMEGAGIVRVPSRLASPKITAFVDYLLERRRGIVPFGAQPCAGK